MRKVIAERLDCIKQKKTGIHNGVQVSFPSLTAFALGEAAGHVCGAAELDVACTQLPMYLKFNNPVGSTSKISYHFHFVQVGAIATLTVLERVARRRLAGQVERN